MSAFVKPRRETWAVLGIIIILGAIVLLLAPEEQTLGSGIRSVYVHVALTWTGMAALVLAGFLGLGLVISARPKLFEWAYTVAWVGLGMFGLGLVLSIIAAGINWGAIFWQEPRTNSVLQVLAAGLIVQVINSWPVPYRLKGLLYFVLAAFMTWSVLITPLILHPGNAARSSPSSAIRFTFLGLFVLCSLAAAWIVLYIQGRRLRGNG